MQNLRYILLLNMLSFVLTSTHADDGSQTLFQLFESRFTTLDSLIFTPQQRAYSIQDSSIYSQYRIISTECLIIDSVIDAQVAADTKAFKHETGLALHGQTYYRLDDQLSLDEDDAVSRYNAKIQVELRWHFLNSAILHREGRIHEIQLQGDIDRLSLNKTNMAQLVADHQEYYHHKYDSLLAGILQHRLANLTLMSQAQMYLLENGNISSDEMLNILNEKAEAERTLATITRSYPLANNLSAPSGIIVEIDTLGLINYIRTHHPDMNMMQLQAELLEQQTKNHTYWTTLNISPFVRYSHYFRTNIPNSANVDLGVSFIIPLSGESSKQRTAMKCEREVLAVEQAQLSDKIMDEVRMLITDIDRLNRTSLGELERMKELKRFLQLRHTAYNNRIGGYNIMLRTKEYNTYLLCWEKFLAYQYQRDCLLMTLQTYLHDISVFEFCVGTVI